MLLAVCFFFFASTSPSSYPFVPFIFTFFFHCVEDSSVVGRSGLLSVSNKEICGLNASPRKFFYSVRFRVIVRAVSLASPTHTVLYNSTFLVSRVSRSFTATVIIKDKIPNQWNKIR
ncbi:uncharacterized protein BO72DRAFT_159105 [Aspergillus fijiensis CBS 313.89]|uniref:Secreted protein n=1 Tax=Aspergillus fijiensis CBS 313.89 TaxID=1448319 RepID=A0A8G1VWM8_9EURO|nr:uncharacterized protein BO72DRAFT_159105 [Aspergillus fijiensis CBS 313.89]RAK75750.1 hypothetical protein BO72DRAFT_159105 [Aspergillus fijiensis CBS 313.89]